MKESYMKMKDRMTKLDISHWDDVHEFKFDVHNREMMVRNVLCDIKGYLMSHQNEFEVTFEKLKYTEGAFGYRFNISPMDDISECLNRKFFRNTFCLMTQYTSDMLDYMFNENIKLVSFYDMKKLEASFEIISDF